MWTQRSLLRCARDGPFLILSSLEGAKYTEYTEEAANGFGDGAGPLRG